MPLLDAATGPARSDEQRLLAYGQHLAQECASCHRLDGNTAGIPSIVGWDRDSFVSVLKSYQSRSRTNPVMVSVARSLDPDQMEALAAYLGRLPRP